MDPRMSYFDPARQFAFIPAPDEEFDVSACFKEGAPGPEGWPDGMIWHLESECGTLCHYNDLGGNPFCDVDYWLLPLTGHTRGEFLITLLEDEYLKFNHG